MEISNEAITSQLKKVVNSEVFSDSNKLQRFLTYIVNESINGESEHLKQYNIAIHAFDRAPDFDSNTDPIVRIQASRLRSSLSSYYRTQGKDDPIFIEVPKGSYKPLIEKHLKSVGDKDFGYQDDVIAVSSFKNLSDDASKQYIADGFTEELLLELARYNHLTIIRLDNENTNSLRNRFARFILRGSLRFSGTRIKLIVNVEDIKTHETIWAHNFDVQLKPIELIASQEEIAKSVANKVGDVIGGVVYQRLIKESTNRTAEDILPYDALLRFYHYQNAPVIDRYKVAVETTKKVLKSDAENGMCWAILANLTIDSVALGYSSSEEFTLEKALEHANKAVVYEPNMQLTRVYLGYAYLMNDMFDEAISEFKLAYDFNSNAAYYVGAIGWGLTLAGDSNMGMDLMEEGIYLNPAYPKWYHLASCAHYLGKGNIEKALIEANKLNITGLFWDPMLKAACYAHLNLQNEAEKHASKLLEFYPNFLAEGKQLIGMYVKQKTQISQIVDGLEKTGLVLI